MVPLEWEQVDWRGMAYVKVGGGASPNLGPWKTQFPNGVFSSYAIERRHYHLLRPTSWKL